MSLAGLLLRFILGGFIVAMVAVVAKKLGDRIGGIFAAFPAIFSSAVIAAVIGMSQTEAARRALAISYGALVGMILNVGCAILTAHLVRRFGWHKGLVTALGVWIILAGIVFVGGESWGWLH